MSADRNLARGPKPATPKSAGFRQPAEWEKHESVWLAWPSHGDLWGDGLEPAREEFTALCEAIADVDPQTKTPRGDFLNILVPSAEVGAEAEQALRHLPVRFHVIPFGDIWLRDTAPVFLKGPSGARASVRFGFNGWGGKYSLPHDTEVSARIAKVAKASAGHERFEAFEFPWILEGGSVEVDGEGTCLTSRQCLLNPNRNRSLSQEQMEEGLRQALGVSKILWVGDGLVNDHTDGHIDTIARFAAPGVALCMKAHGAHGTEGTDDPNHAIMERISRDLQDMTDAAGRALKVVHVPSPGVILDEEGRVMPASYLNFYISNSTVVVPVYGSVWDRAAVEAIAACFPGRRTLGLSAKAILSGGGAFHCITQQQPL